MNWLKNAATWLGGFWKDNRVTAVRHYSYETMLYAFNQANTLPKLAWSVANHIPTQTVAKHVLRIAAEDIVPLVLINYANQMIQSIGQDYMTDNEDDSWLGVNATIQTSLYLLETGVWIYNIRKKSEFLVRTVAVTIEAPSMLHCIDKSRVMTVCRDEHCTALRFIQGTIRDITTYCATEAAISLIDYVPVVGPTVGSALSLYHHGRYILTVALPDLCNRHQVIYLREHSEIALSLGLGYAGSTWLVNTMIEKTTGIPQSFYAGQVKQLMIIMHMGLALQLNLPKAPKVSTRALPDPVLLYQNAVGFIFDTNLLGLKAKLTRGSKPGRLKENLRAIPWGAMDTLSASIRRNSVARIFLPPMLHDFNGFIGDPIIRSNWLGIHNAIIHTLENVIAYSGHFLVRISSAAPNPTSFFMQTAFGTPKFITKTMLELISDKEVIALMLVWQKAMKNLNPDPVCEIEDSYAIEDNYVLVGSTSDREDGSVLVGNDDINGDAVSENAVGIHSHQYIENYLARRTHSEANDDLYSSSAVSDKAQSRPAHF